MRADLHVHTALSPCGSEEMTPPAIVATAIEAGLDMIAVCDHNTAGNVAAVQEAADGLLAVLAGVEFTTNEEVHVVGLFPDAEAAQSAAAAIHASLPVADERYYSFMGEQMLMDCDGNVTGSETAALIAATGLDLNDTVALIKRFGGLAVAAHIDRRAFGIISQLGWFPMDAGFDAIEVSRHTEDGSERMKEFRALGLPITGSSDGHYLNEIAKTTTLIDMVEPTFDEVVRAFRGDGDRRVQRA
jgi:3',5'-nucleoside bisphosphate phosphatase